MTTPASSLGKSTIVAPAGTPVAPRGWTIGRIVALVVGTILVLFSVASLAVGGIALGVDRTQRDSAGFLNSSSETLATPTYALVTKAGDINVSGPSWLYSQSVLGKVRVRATSTASSTPIFIGIGATSDVNRYLGSVERAAVTDITNSKATYRTYQGGSPATKPDGQPFWSASSSGTGERTLIWPVKAGSWTLVVMNANARAGVSVRGNVGATVPVLKWIGIGPLAFGVILLLGGSMLVIGAIRRSTRSPG
jgi:hypothetical protein